MTKYQQIDKQGQCDRCTCLAFTISFRPAFALNDENMGFIEDVYLCRECLKEMWDTLESVSSAHKEED